MKTITKTILSLVLVTSYPALANQVNISKLRLEIVGAKQSEYLTLKNENENEKQAFEITLKRWRQDTNVNDKINEKNISPKNILDDTDDLAVFPKTIVLAPNQEKVVRVLIKNTEESMKNYAYRMQINQLPSQNVETQGNSLTWLFNVSVPVFVAKKNITSLGDMQVDYNYNRQENYVTIINNSDSHLQIKEIICSTGKQSMNFYILPKMTQKIYITPNSNNVNIVTDKGNLIIN